MGARETGYAGWCGVIERMGTMNATWKPMLDLSFTRVTCVLVAVSAREVSAVRADSLRFNPVCLLVPSDLVLLLSLSAVSRLRVESVVPLLLASDSCAEDWLLERVLSSVPEAVWITAWLYFVDSSVPVCWAIRCI